MKRLMIKSILALAPLVALGFANVATAQERTLKFATNAVEGHPAVVGMRKFAELVNTKSGGKMKVNLFLNGTLGSDQSNVSSVKGGTIDMAVLNTGILASEVKELAIFDFPFLFTNEKESDALVDGPIGKKLHAKLEEKGIIGLAYWELGYRHITNNKRPLVRVEDIDGLKLRVIPNPINVAWVKALGANPTPLSFPELYAALEQKAVDGQENPIAVIAANKFWEVQKFITITNHQYNPQTVLFSKKVWDTLSASEKKILEDSAAEAAVLQRKEGRAVVESNLELLRKNGMTVSQFSPAEITKLREKMKPVIAQFSANVGEATVNEVMAELAKLRK